MHPRAQSPFPSVVTVASGEVPAGSSLDAVATQVAAELARSAPFFRQLSIAPARVAGIDALRLGVATLQF